MQVLRSIVVLFFSAAVAIPMNGLLPNHRKLNVDYNDYKSACASNGVGLTLAGATVTTNNLGGVGPDSDPDEIMKIENIGVFNGNSLDIVLSINDNFTYDAVNNRNGLLCELNSNQKPIASNTCGDDYKFGQINLKSNRTTTVVFKIVDHVTGDPVTLPAFVFSIFDVDKGGKTDEIYAVKGWESVVFVDNPNMDITTDASQEPVLCNTSDNCLVAKATEDGGGCNNPTSPMDLSIPPDCDADVEIITTSFMLIFENTDTFEVYMDYPSTKTSGARNMLWAFTSELSEECESDPSLC